MRPAVQLLTADCLRVANRAARMRRESCCRCLWRVADRALRAALLWGLFVGTAVAAPEPNPDDSANNPSLRAPPSAPASNQSVSGESPLQPAGESWVIDRAVVRFTAPETGGVELPRFIFERELAFEARLEALADDAFVPSEDTPYLDIHIRAALERHVAETILETLEVTPQPTPDDIQRRVNSAQAALIQRVGGADLLEAAARKEGFGSSEIFRMLQRQARASLYLDRMVAPMLRPSEAELQALHQAGRTPFTKEPFEAIKVPLRRWYVSRRLSAALRDYYEGARSRLVLHVL